ncbi:uncharacterized protein I206_106412 [Kwoniella pini CBS 10737]|uniref:BZIP domain-containing protein n=1 Tax=Kwoniella pini CBS 10737 TaxID=1296096 RepID=A0A1B9HU84_9TREE|nr:uncharacterized protein I206_07216 [Kwoniella pini CBS 10737]OCF46829.1 hypothetical protein I206_07216 [Kwoniella pini CBS 10737]
MDYRASRSNAASARDPSQRPASSAHQTQVMVDSDPMSTSWYSRSNSQKTYDGTMPIEDIGSGSRDKSKFPEADRNLASLIERESSRESVLTVSDDETIRVSAQSKLRTDQRRERNKIHQRAFRARRKDELNSLVASNKNLERELAESKDTIRERDQKIVDLETARLELQRRLEQLETQNSQLQTWNPASVIEYPFFHDHYISNSGPNDPNFQSQDF